MHIGQTATNHFYYDPDRTTPGDDADTQSGIDQAMLFFYAGHGSPLAWDTLGNSASQPNMCLGDCPGDGLLRYYWQCSCNVFAHGPHDCTSSPYAYSCPQDFDGSADSWSMRNVYERWGPALDPDLRMACGVSTLAYCHETQTNRIWNNYNNNGFDVADSFIDGLQGGLSVVPLCITTGGWTGSSTPLFDASFTNAANPSGKYYHIQFLSQFASTVPTVVVRRVPELLPILEVIPLPLPGPLRTMQLIDSDGMKVSSDKVDGRGPRVRIYPVSGAVYIRGPRKVDLQQPPLSEAEYVEQALRHIRELGWSERDATKPQGASNYILTTPIEAPTSETGVSQKNVIVRIRRTRDVEGEKLPVFGEGGMMTVQMNNDGSLLNASKVWRPVRSQKMARVKTYDEAYAEALQTIQDTTAYTLHDWFWGYKEAAGNVEQNVMRVFYRFEFHPRDERLTREYPPQIVQIRGHVE